MRDEFNRQWITENALSEISNYEKGVLTLRALHYRLVSRGMTNSMNHYKRVVKAMIKARWEGIVDFDTFSDHDRDVLGWTEYTETNRETQETIAKRQIKEWMTSYNKRMWENQEFYIEVWIEKKALQGVFEPICSSLDVALAPCKGYPSLTFIHEAKERFEEAVDTHTPKILYFGDYDPSGEDIPRSIKENLENMGISVEVDRRLLLKDQVLEWNLPPAPAKLGDSRTANWDGLGQVELDAVEPNKLKDIVKSAILEHRDEDLYQQLLEQEEEERQLFRTNMESFLREL